MKRQTKLITAFAAATAAFSLSANAALVTVTSASGHNGGNGHSNGDLSDAYSTSGIDTSADPNDPSQWITNSSGWTEGWGASAQLDPVGPPATANGKIGWITFDFGSTVTGLDQMYIWNRRDNGQDEGVDSYNLYYATAPTVAVPAPVGSGTTYGDYDFASGGWTAHSSGNLTIRAAQGNGAEDVLALGGISARYVAVEILSSINPDNRVGLDEVAFTNVVPEPTTTALLGLGGLALIFRRRK